MSQTPTCLITGATGGIGAALCEAYTQAGWHVIATGRADDAAEIACDRYIPLDLVSLVRSEDTRSAFEAAIKVALADGRLDTLVNNAALQVLGSTADVSVEQLRTSFDVNAVAPFTLVQMVLSELRAAKGTVVNIGTVHAQSTKPGFVAYATSKTALHGLTRALAVDLGPDVRVNTLAPAATATPMLLAGFDGNPDGFADLAGAHPLDRIADPAEIAKAALFLSGNESSFVTGATLFIDGGVLSRLHDPA